MPTNLFDYYRSKGQSLPSLSERGKLFSNYGLGSGYIGSASQNAALLQKLLNEGGGAAPAPAAPAPAAPASPSMSDVFQKALNMTKSNFQPLIDTNNTLVANQQGLNNTQTKTLEDRLRENAGYAMGAIKENQNNLGLLQSGSTSNQIEGIQRDLGNNLSQADIQNAINNANAALQGLQTNVGLSTPISSATYNGLNFGANSAGALSQLLLNPLYHNIPDAALRQILLSYGFNGGA